MNTIKIDAIECSGCKTCFNACFVDVFRWDATEDRPIVAYPEECVQCGTCELNCPAECIHVVVDYDNKYWPPVF